MTKPTFPSPSAGSVLVPRELTEGAKTLLLRDHLLIEDDAQELWDELLALTAAPAPVLVIELDQPRIADGGQCNEQQPHAPSPVSK